MYRLCINRLIQLKEVWYSKPLSIFGNVEKTDLIGNLVNEDLHILDTQGMQRSQFGFAVRDSVPRTNAELYEAVKHFDDLCYHSGPNRQVYTSDILMLSYKALELPKNLTVDNLRRAAMFGWALENATTGIFLADDITDSNTLRWNKPCWHTLPHVGLRALIDIRLLTMGSSQIIRKHFKDFPTYIQLQTLFNEFLYITFLGQSFDLHNSSLFKNYRDESSLSMTRFKAIAKVKTGFIMYVTPPLAAIYLANLDPQIFMKSKHIFESIAVHRQAQNDMQDCFSEPHKTGKRSTDILEGKCSWITATVMMHGSKKQKSLFLENYGREESDCHNVVRAILKELDIIGKYNEYTQDVISECNVHVKTVAHPGISKIINLLAEEYVNVEFITRI